MIVIIPNVNFWMESRTLKSHKFFMGILFLTKSLGLGLELSLICVIKICRHLQ